MNLAEETPGPTPPKDSGPVSGRDPELRGLEWLGMQGASERSVLEGCLPTDSTSTLLGRLHWGPQVGKLGSCHQETPGQEGAGRGQVSIGDLLEYDLATGASNFWRVHSGGQFRVFGSLGNCNYLVVACVGGHGVPVYEAPSTFMRPEWDST